MMTNRTALFSGIRKKFKSGKNSFQQHTVLEKQNPNYPLVKDKGH